MQMLYNVFIVFEWQCHSNMIFRHWNLSNVNLRFCGDPGRILTFEGGHNVRRTVKKVTRTGQLKHARPLTACTRSRRSGRINPRWHAQDHVIQFSNNSLPFHTVTKSIKFLQAGSRIFSNTFLNFTRSIMLFAYIAASGPLPADMQPVARDHYALPLAREGPYGPLTLPSVRCWLHGPRLKNIVKLYGVCMLSDVLYILW